MFVLWKQHSRHSDIDRLYIRARSNDVDAQYELSLAYYKGIDIPKDMKKSNYWFEKANMTSRIEGDNR